MQFVSLALVAYCKSGNFYIHIWAGTAISSAKEGKPGFIYNLVKVNKLFGPHMHFVKILTVYTLNSHLLTLKAHNHKMYVFCRPLKHLKPHRQAVWTQIRLLSDLCQQYLPLCLC